MRSTLNPVIAAVLVASMVRLAAWAGDETGAGWSIGYAQADITPDPGQCMMAGYGRERYAQGTLAPLLMQVVAFQDGHAPTAILITADLLEFDRTTVTAVRRAIGREHRIPASHILFAASHTHWGPATCFHGSYSIGAPNVWYLGTLEDKILAGVDQALGNVEPATLEYGAIDFRDIGRNRRLPRDGGISFGPNPSGSFDGHTPIIRIRRKASPKQVIIVGHACHPTSSGPIEQWSPDYPGAMRETLERQLTDTHAVFVQGCGADAKIVHRDATTGDLVFTADPEHAAAAGRKLGNAVRDYLEQDRLTSIRPKVICGLETGELRYGERWSRAEIERLAYEGSRKSWLTWAARQHLAMPDHSDSFRYDVQIWRLGDRLTLLGMEGEICSPWGPILRSMADTDLAMVIGYANCTAAYIPDLQILREGGYEGESSQHVYRLPAPFSEQIEEEIKAIAKRALAEVGDAP